MKKYLSKHKPKHRIHEEAFVPSTIETAPPMDTLDRGPSDVRGHFQQFRILVMGRANAGKTTLLQKVCNTTEDPEVFDGQGNQIDATVVEGCLGQGEHEIENELIFKSNPGFVFHDSSGFEAGSKKEFDDMKEFVTERAITRELKKRIHAIWFCIPMTDHERMVTAAEEKFFDECNTGNVPVIVILTKCDTLRAAAFNHLRNEEFSKEEAREKAGKKAENMLEGLLADIKEDLGKRSFPPTDYLLLAKMNAVNTDCGPLLTATATALNEESLKQLLISTQRTNLMLCIGFAIKGVCDKPKMDKWKGTPDEKRALQREILTWFPYFQSERRSLLRVLESRFFWKLLLWKLRKREKREELKRRRLLQQGFELRLDLFRETFLFDLEELSKLFQIDPVLRLAAVDAPDVPLVSQASMMSPTQHILTFAISVILVVEYAYFFMQKRTTSSKEVFASAAQQYHHSGIQIDVQRAIALAIDQNSTDMEQLCCAILKITLEHCMSHNLLN